MKRILSVCTLFSSLLFASAEYVPLQERAQGHSLTGANLQNDSLYSNPASGAFEKIYSLDGNYGLNGDFAVSVLDTRTSNFGGGLAYYRQPVEKTGDPEKDTDGKTQGARVSLFRKSTETLAFGITGKMIWSPALTQIRKDRDNVTSANADIGMLSNFGNFQLGTNIRNIMGENAELKMKREMALGGRLNWNQLLFFSLTTVSDISALSFDAIKPYEYGLGAEFITPYYFSIKGGYRYQMRESFSTWSMGASFISPKFSLHYALELPQYVNGKSEHIFGMTVYL